MGLGVLARIFGQGGDASFNRDGTYYDNTDHTHRKQRRAHLEKPKLAKTRTQGQNL